MKRKVLAIMLIAVFIFAQLSVVVDAKGGGGRSFGGSRSSSSSSRSFSSSSKSSGYSGSSKSSGSTSSKSSGYSGSSKSSGSTSSKSSGYSGSSKSSGSTSSKSSGYSGSSGSSGSSTGSSRSIPGSYSGSSTSKSNSSTSPKTTTAKNAYMQDTYKKQASSSNYKTYKQNLNSEQTKVYQSSLNRNYQYNRMDFDTAMKTRPQRITVIDRRPIIVTASPAYFGGPIMYGSAHVGIWDLWFLMRASDLFWYHHWADIYPYRNYFEAQRFADMERRIRVLEQQNIARNSNYLDPNVDPDLQFSDDYMQGHTGNVYYTNKHSGISVMTIVIIILIIIVLVIILRRLSRPKSSFNSRIY